MYSAVKILVICALMSFLLSLHAASPPDAAGKASDVSKEEPTSREAPQGNAHVIEIHDIIDLGLAFFVKRSLSAAETAGAEQVILDINTFGGRVDAAVEIRDALDACEIPTTAYVNMRAISAGALICLATDEITMAPGSSIGAATPVGMGGAGEKLELGEKEKSYVRGEFRASAERNGHSPLLAEAMVDPDLEVFGIVKGERLEPVSPAEAEKLKKTDKKIEIETISAKGKLLTMTASEAIKAGLAGSTPASLDELIESLGLDPESKIVSSISWSEYLVRFLTHPVVSGLLLTFGVMGIFFELQMAGWGISGTLGAVCLVLFFGGHYLAGLASVADVALFMIGIALVALEVFVVPGFGITGASGIACIMAGIYLALVKRSIPQFSWDYQELNSAMLTFVFFMVATTLGIVIIWKISPDSRLKKAMVLSTSLPAEKGYTSSENLAALLGHTGKSLTHLRPAGRALIDGDPYEAQSEGEFIEKNRPLTVVRVAGNKLFVAEIEEREEA
jgi:membrane-bound serine protease (ClpP class)